MPRRPEPSDHYAGGQMTPPREPAELAEKYGPKVRWLRQGAQLSGRELCRRVGVTPSYLSDIEVSRRLPSPEVSDRIADALSVDRDALWRLALLERLSDRDLAALRAAAHRPDVPGEAFIGPEPAATGSICKCGLAKSYHPRLADHEYEPRYAAVAAPGDEALRTALERLPRLWWCPAWGTLNEKQYHGNDGPDDPNCGKVAYVRDTDLRSALASPAAARFAPAPCDQDIVIEALE